MVQRVGWTRQGGKGRIATVAKLPLENHQPRNCKGKAEQMILKSAFTTQSQRECFAVFIYYDILDWWVSHAPKFLFFPDRILYKTPVQMLRFPTLGNAP